ncbi:hypothetical protein KI387_032936 [Taxus chinensis]|uniref:TIR domain-containing protein n=1 Tax=Taxus chinensis TaxID=29808 RepID=A0AA38F0H6_TAXCH|nr:hypothetical protein KI387_032936 [Taxus chinensis]
MASSSSLHAFSGIESPAKRRKVDESSRLFDVFINHRGPDVKQTLATQLYNSLRDLGIKAFLDSEEKELGDSFPSTIQTAIRSAAVHVAIFSKNYAHSPWCLAELVLMLQSPSKIIPVFYDVQPWELRHIENGVYGEAFTVYEKKGRHLDKLKEWKEALQSVSLITGEEFYRFSHCKTIVSAVEKEFRRRKNLHVAKYPVGLHKLVEEFERRCLNELVKDFDSHCAIREESKDKAKIVGIFGMGGVGKTTLSKELFNRKKWEYTRSSFLFDVREVSSTSSGLVSLQIKLLKDLFDGEPPNFQSAEEGTSYLRDCLGRSRRSLKFLIFLDDIDHVEQLDALLVKDMLNKCADSLIIITTRDVGVLISAGINAGYQLKGMDTNDGGELFCWHAFGQPHPASGFDNLVEDFVRVCGGLPLSLQVLGRHVHGRTQNYWLSEFNKVSKMLPRDIMKKLKISFDALESEEKQIFMDIACFFVDKRRSIAVRVWEGSGWQAQHALQTLIDKCLVEEIRVFNFTLDGLESTELRMHDHLRDLGREMANAPTHSRRLWCQQDLISLEFMGFQNILTQTKGRCFHSIFDKSMCARATYFVADSNDSGKASTSLLWLHLELNSSTHYPSIPSWIPLQNLQYLRISNGRLERLWQSNVQTPSQLKELQIYQTFVEEFPDMLEISNKLEMVVLDAEHMPIRGYSLSGSLRMNLSTCDSRIEWASVKPLSKFKSKGEMTLNIDVESWTVETSMSGLENLEIRGKNLVTKILISGNHCPRLESLKLHDMANLIEVDLSSVKSLNCLEVTNCISLQRISATFDLTNLVEFNISQCPEFKELCFGRVSCLGKFTIKNCLKRVAEISDLGKLVELNISGCRRLQELRLSHLSSLERITIVHCKQLKSVSGMSDLRKLVEYNISECCKLQEISFVHSSCLERITIEYCKILKTVSAMEGLEKLVTLNIRDCPELERLLVNLRRVSEISDLSKLIELNISDCPEHELELSLVGMNCLESITVDGCGKLKSFELNGCKNLQSVSGMSGLEELAILIICECPELENLPCLQGLSCLEMITIHGCEKLNYLAVQSCENLKKVLGNFDLKRLSICDCPELDEFPCFTLLTCPEEISMVRCGNLLNACAKFKSASELKSELRNLVKLKIIGLTQFEEFSVAHLSCLEEMTIESCQILKRVSGIPDLSKLIELNISKCPELELELSLARMNCLKSITVDGCGKLKSVELNGCKNLQSVSGMSGLEELAIFNICQCPELEYLEELQGLGCLEMITIDGCGRLRYLTIKSCENLERVSAYSLDLKRLILEDCSEFSKLLLDIRHPIRIEEISIYNCGKLQNIISAISSLMNLEKLEIKKCRELEELSVAHLSCLRKIKIENCQNLRRVSGLSDLSKLRELNIYECPELEELSVAHLSCLEEMTIYNCQNLRRVSGLSDLSKLRELNISECPELEELQSLARLSCLESLDIHKCEKLQGISGIQELRALKSVQIGNCIKGILNCIDMFQSVPSLEYMCVMGRAGDGAESALNPQFLDGLIDADAVIEFDPLYRGPLEMMTDELSAVIVCAVLVVHTSTQPENWYSLPFLFRHYKMEGEGEWIITKVITGQQRINSYNGGYARYVEHVLAARGIWKKGYRVMVKKGEEWKTLHLLKTIINRLHEK